MIPVLPTIHLNGTSRETLTEEYDLTDAAFGEFVKAFHRTTFHPRDYYVQGSNAWPNAVLQRQEINRMLVKIQSYLNEHREHLHNPEQ
jgi:hypothetical protein